MAKLGEDSSSKWEKVVLKNGTTLEVTVIKKFPLGLLVALPPGKEGDVPVIAIPANTILCRLPTRGPKRNKPAGVKPVPAPGASALRTTTAEVKFIFHLASGGRLKAVSYEEKGDKYAIKLAAGSTTIPMDIVDRIEPLGAKKE